MLLSTVNNMRMIRVTFRHHDVKEKKQGAAAVWWDFCVPQFQLI